MMNLSNIQTIDTNYHDSLFYKDTLTLDVSDKICKLFLEDKLWEGTFTVDNGWGPKDRILNQVDPDVFGKENLPFFIEPIKSKTPLKEYYKIVSTGFSYKLLLLWIQKLNSFDIKKQEYTLRSYYELNDVKPGSDVYELKINVVNGKVSFNMTKMKWTPSPENGLIVGKW